jgi:hypothetical protein
MVQAVTELQVNNILLLNVILSAGFDASTASFKEKHYETSDSLQQMCVC